MPKSIFDLVTADQITAYWDVTKQNMAPVLGEELFPADKKLGLDLKWLHGAKGLPVVFWIPCMLIAVGLMYAYMAFCCDDSRNVI